MRLEMRMRTLLLLAALLLVAATSNAQDFFPGPTVYARMEGLLWTIQDAPLPFPLLTSTDGNAIGTVGDANTRVLLGTQALDLGVRNGSRFTAGAWLDPEESYGVEGSLFSLDRFGTTRSFTDGSGTRRLAIPFFDAAAGVPSAYVLSAPSTMTPPRTIFIPDREGTITIPGVVIPGASAIVGYSTRSQLLGYDLNGMIGASGDGPFRIELLGGYRYLRLSEDLLLLAQSTSQPASSNVFITSDSFSTRNSFYGGQVGARVAFDGGVVFADVTGKFAAGPMTQQVDVAGSFLTTAFDPAHAPSVFPSGVFVQRTNGGTTTSTQFAVASELQANAGIQYGPVRAFLGYSFLYVTSVARPGNQIDPSINPNQSEALLRTANPPGVGNGPLAPSRPVASSSFWAEGINIGIEVRY